MYDAGGRSARGVTMRLQTSLGIAIGTALGTLVVARSLRARRAIDLAGKTVVIFGGSRGLGLAMAREFAAAGARLVLAARDEQELERAAADIEQRGAEVTTIKCDITDRGQIERTIGRIIHDQGVIDVLVNDAGVIQVGPLEHMTIDDFDYAMKVHFWGPLLTILTALPHMRERGARRIVNISSIGGKIAVPHLLPYTASKFALTGLSEGLRRAAIGVALGLVAAALLAGSLRALLYGITPFDALTYAVVAGVMLAVSATAAAVPAWHAARTDPLTSLRAE
jgi:NAD(P)-dependent dehydrogenase (short-subunit alcohol dehydrogenase family)